MMLSAKERRHEANAGKSHLSIIPIEFADACFFVDQTHRHHKAPTGHKFSLAVVDEAGAIRGVATVGRPVARHLDNGWTLEVNRVATDGCPNACSALYQAAWRAARALGYRKLITYTLKEEPGTSLKSIQWKCIGEAGGGSWDTPLSNRPRVDRHPTQTKIRWEMEAA
jgi:hypothetical protein